MNTEKNYVIALSGTVASGKSTVAKELIQRLGNAVWIKFDDYAKYIETWPDDMRKWLDEGADVSIINNFRLLNDLKLLLNNEPITCPTTKKKIHPTKYIVFENPFGREKDDFTELIDFLIFIDTPQDIALQRVLYRILNEKSSDNSQLKESDPDKILKKIEAFLQFYQNFARDMYVTISQRVKLTADLILDGLKTTDEIVDDVITKIKRF